MSDFNFVPSYTTSGSDKFAELTAQFGDGYDQTSPDGINSTKEIWNLVFDGISKSSCDSIRSFFRSKTGKKFTWTNPSGVEKRYKRTGDVTFVPSGPDSWNVTVTIEEAFGV